MQTVIIKSNKDSFEKLINESFKTNDIIVIPIENIVKEKRGLSKIRNILRALINLKKHMTVDKIIVFDDSTCYLITALLFNNSFLWLWNTLPRTKSNRVKIPICKLIGHVYSFDQNDCIEYRIKENSQFMISYENGKNSITHDIYFVGTDKNRYELVNSVYNYCAKHNIKTLFQLVPDRDINYNKEIVTNHFVTYDEVLQNIKCSKAILDICKPGQTGTTYRVMEALLFNKKIVTNNEHYKELPYYSPDKIYIIKPDDHSFSGMLDFITSKEIEYDEEIKEYYQINNWLKRFEL